ncbi:type II toxin-antitoxin system PemK/MazF family toxin [Microtetraspora malaysiensis]|uniref:type II toxin-antitoxin system PemK/MazF family toxin n=1 Tax=Microtetraspora malaysiensis TaxID=161358 RepID=UPI000AA75E55|nr:type II toxin-antitoxin system PemK/MazF family toxin [Microtetraspora malaysiensis]
MQIRQGDIWWADLGEPAGREQGYVRPALVISNDRTIRTVWDPVLAVPLTTRFRGWETHVEIEPEGTGLPKSSWAMVEQVRAISPARFGSRIGGVSLDVVSEIAEWVREML